MYINRPEYIPLKAWELMSQKNKEDFYKNSKKKEIIDLTKEENQDIEKKNIKNEMEIFKLNSLEEIKTFKEYYNNKLNELTKGCWILKDKWNRKQIQIVNTTYMKNIKYKIYTNYNILPLENENIERYELYIDSRETNNFDGKILYDEWDNIREYIVLIYLKDNKYPICYEYNFSKLQYNNEKYNNKEYGKIMEEKKELEFKLFILNNMKNN